MGHRGYLKHHSAIYGCLRCLANISKRQRLSFIKTVYPKLYHFYKYLLSERDSHENHLIGILNPDESGEDNPPRFDIPLGLPSLRSIVPLDVVSSYYRGIDTTFALKISALSYTPAMRMGESLGEQANTYVRNAIAWGLAIERPYQEVTPSPIGIPITVGVREIYLIY